MSILLRGLSLTMQQKPEQQIYNNNYPNRKLSLSWMRLPWSFSDEATEHAFYAKRRAEWASGSDQWVAVPWFLLWISIIARHWGALSWYSIFRSSVHCAITCGPAYWRLIVGKQRYERYRNLFVAAAIISYTMHPGGGLYRDAVMLNQAEHTGLDVINLFVRLLVGSRTLFWLILIFGYELPPEMGVPLNALCLLVMSRLKPSAPFCATMQTPTTNALFQKIAASLPLFSSISFEHPQLSANADVCNPLVHWMVACLAFLLPAFVHLAGDYNARLAFARRYPLQLSPADRQVWLNRARSAFSPWPIACLVFAGLSSALWSVFTWKEHLLSVGPAPAPMFVFGD